MRLEGEGKERKERGLKGRETRPRCVLPCLAPAGAKGEGGGKGEKRKRHHRGEGGGKKRLFFFCIILGEEKKERETAADRQGTSDQKIRRESEGSKKGEKRWGKGLPFPFLGGGKRTGRRKGEAGPPPPPLLLKEERNEVGNPKGRRQCLFSSPSSPGKGEREGDVR